jgi:hypothetical protein
MMSKLLQGVLYIVFGVFVGYLSVAPTYNYANPDRTSVKLSLSHAANRVHPCTKLSPQEINELAASGERFQKCERERLPLTVVLEIDGDLVYKTVARPSGLWGDGPASVYERFEIAPGPHQVTARLRDSTRDSGWDYTHSEQVNLEPGRYFTITFRAETGGFQFR